MAEPVSLAEAKAQTNMVNDNSQDTYLTSLIAPARAYVERVSRFFWVAASRTETFGRWGDYLELTRRPVTGITTITYTDEDGNAGTAYTGFIASIGTFSTRIYPAIDDTFPTLGTGGIITVTYAGAALASTTEEYLIGKQAMLLLIGHWFENRESVVVGAPGAGAIEVPQTVTDMLDMLRPVSAY